MHAFLVVTNISCNLQTNLLQFVACFPGQFSSTHSTLCYFVLSLFAYTMQFKIFTLFLKLDSMIEPTLLHASYYRFTVVFTYLEYMANQNVTFPQCPTVSMVNTKFTLTQIIHSPMNYMVMYLLQQKFWTGDFSKWSYVHVNDSATVVAINKWLRGYHSCE